MKSIRSRMFSSWQCVWLRWLCVGLLANMVLAAEVSAGELELPLSLREVADKYGISIIALNKTYSTSISDGVIAAHSPGRQQLEVYARIFATEFNLYPRDFVRRMKIRRIVLVRALAFNGHKRAAVPDFVHGVLYFDVERGTWNRQYQQRVIHHEMFHVVDWRDDGSLYDDPAWKMLNSVGFVYGAGGVSAQDDMRASLLDDSLDGFLTKYSMAGVEEDKAEFFACLMVNHATVVSRAEQDAVIQAKVDMMQNLLKEFSADMNDHFWSWVRKNEHRAMK